MTLLTRPMTATRSLAAAATVAFLLTQTMTLSVGCQSAPHYESHPRFNNFQSIQLGMDKGKVIEVAGNPTSTRRWQGLDRWIYIFPPTPADHAPAHPAQALVKEVHFKEGIVVHIGDPVKPALSAEEQDRANAESNAAEDARLSEEARAAADTRTRALFTRPSTGSDNGSGPGLESELAPEREVTKPKFEPVD